MANYLSERDWKSLLSRKEHKGIKDSSVSAALKSYEKAKDSAALDRVIAAAKKLKATKGFSSALVDHLDAMVDAAEEAKLAAGSEEGPADLKSLLTSVKSRGPDKPMRFAIAMGKTAGLVVRRKSITAGDKKEADKLRNKSGSQPVQVGLLYFEGGKYVFDFGDDRPSGGVAKQIKRSIKRTEQMNVRVLVRGGGQEFDDESDQEAPDPGPAGGAATATATTTATASSSEQRVAGFERTVLTTLASPPGDPAVALHKIIRLGTAIGLEVKGDAGLATAQQLALLQRIAAVVQRAKDRLGNPAEAFTRRFQAMMPEIEAAKAANPTTAAGIAARQEFATTLAQVIAKRKADDLAGASAMLDGLEAAARKTIAANGTTDPAAAFDAALARVTAELRAANAIQPQNTAQQAVRGAFVTALTAMQRAAAQRDYATAGTELQKATVTARRLLQARDAATTADTERFTAQRAQFDELQGIANDVMRSYLSPEGKRERDKYVGLRDLFGSKFKLFSADMTRLEQARAAAKKGAARDPAAVRAQRTAAEAVLKSGADFLASSAQATGKDTPRMRQICEEGVKQARHLLLALTIQELGAPKDGQAWTEEQEIRAVQLRAQLAFETGSDRGSSLNDAGVAGVNKSFWLERRDPGAAKATKQFIFKPIDETLDEDDRRDAAAAAAKEALASANAKRFEQMTGIALGVPETSVAAIGGYALQVGDEDKGKVFLGSVQQFAPTDGELREQGAAALRRVPAAECQRMAINDIMCLNIDRHMGNFLVRNGSAPGSGPSLVPIDHGLTLPSMESFKETAENIGGLPTRDDKTLGAVKNALLAMPGSHEPFAPDVVERLRLLDPDAIANGMRSQLASLDAINPQLGSRAAVDDSSIELSRRSLVFLKMAAGTLSPAQIQIAIGQNPDLFTGPANAFEAGAKKVIAALAPQRAAHAEVFTMPTDLRTKMINTLIENGWNDAQKLVMSDPATALKLYEVGARKGRRAPAEEARSCKETDAIAINVGRLVRDAEDLLAKYRPNAAALASRLAEIRARQTPDLPSMRAWEKDARKAHGDAYEACADHLRAQAQDYFDRNHKRVRDRGLRVEFEQNLKEILACLGAVQDLAQAAKLFPAEFERTLKKDAAHLAADRAKRTQAVLSLQGWQRLVAQPANRQLKDRTVETALAGYERAKSPESLAEVITAARALAKKATNSELADYLDELADLAEEAREKLVKAGDANAEVEPLAGDLRSMLATAKTRDRFTPVHFVVAPGKTAGLVVHRTGISATARKKAVELRGQSGGAPPIVGVLYNESGKYVFDLADEKPPAGLAKQIKRAIKSGAELNVAVLVRGGGRDLDDESDVEPAAPDPVPETPKSKTEAAVVEFVRYAAARVAEADTDPGVKLIAIVSAAARQSAAIAADAALTPTERARLDKMVADSVAAARTLSGTPRTDFLMRFQAIRPLVERAKAVQPDDGAGQTTKQAFHDALTQCLQASRSNDYAGATALLAPLEAAAQRTIALAEGGDPAATFRTALERAMPDILRARKVDSRSKVAGDLRTALDTEMSAVKAATDGKDYGTATTTLAAAMVHARRLLLLQESATAARRDQAAAQRKQFAELSAVANQVLRTYRNPAAKSDRDKYLGVTDLLGSPFKKFADAMTRLEKVMGLVESGKTVSDRQRASQAARVAADAVLAAGTAFLARSEPEKDRPTNDKTERMRAIVIESMKKARHWSLALAIKELEVPLPGQPWTDEQQIRATAMRAQLAFETGYKPGSSLRAEGAGGINQAFWVESKAPGADQPTKNFIFKPAWGVMDGDEGDRGTGRESAAARAATAKEALAHANAQLIERMTGIRLGVPETSVASIGLAQLDPSAVKANSSASDLGSIQQFERTDGDVAALPNAELQAIDPGECQRMAVLDIIGLNNDRHGGNFLVRKGAGPNGTPQLVPIDNGNTFPTPAEFTTDRRRLGVGGFSGADVKNVLLTLPGSHAPFSPEMLERISLIDPDAMVAGMKSHLAGLDSVHPELGGRAVITDESLELSKRSLEFLKLAAGRLSPALVQIALADHAEEIADLGKPIPSIAPAIINDVLAKGDAHREFLTMPAPRRKAVVNGLRKNGWPNPEVLLMNDPATALKLFKGAVQHDPKQTPQAQAAGQDTDTGRANHTAECLQEVQQILAAEQPKDAAKFAALHAQLSATVPANSRALGELERQATRLLGDVVEACMAEISAAAKKRYEEVRGRLRTQRGRAQLEMAYDAFKKAGNIADAKLFFQDVQGALQLDRS